MMEPLLEKIKGETDVLSTADINKYIHMSTVGNRSVFAIEKIPDYKKNNIIIPRAGKGIKKIHLEIDSSYTQCTLLSEFLEGTRDIKHLEKYGILLNLRLIRGGRKQFQETIRKYENSITVKKWDAAIRDCNSYGYDKPMKCENFCPYCMSCPNKGTIIQALKQDNKILEIEPPEYDSLDEANEQLRNNVRAAFITDDEGIHLIRAQTGLGKTAAYIDEIVMHPQTGFVIAAPTNALKMEVYNRLTDMGIAEEEIFVTPSVRGNPYVPSDVQERILNEYSRGRRDRTKPILKELIGDKKGNRCSKKMVREVERIIAGMSSYKDERIIVTTHAFFLHIPQTVMFKKTIIIDEDILQQFFNHTFVIGGDELKIVRDSGISGYSEIADIMLKGKKGWYAKLEKIRSSELSPQELEELDKVKYFKGNVNDLFQARAFVHAVEENTGEEYVQYMCPCWFRSRKVIIFSATLNSQIYEAYFSGIKIHTYPVLEPGGNRHSEPDDFSH